MKFLSFAVVIFYLNCSLAKDYTNYKVFDVTAKKAQFGALMSWEHKSGIDFWTTGGTGRPSKVMVSPEIEDSFLDFLERNQIQYNLVIKDVQPNLLRDKADRLSVRSKRSVLADETDPDFGLFWTYEEMREFTINLQTQYPNLVKRDVIGKSIEGRDIFGLRVSSGSQEFGKKPIIFVDAGVHAREWVGPASALYLLNQLVSNPGVSSELLDKVDWVIVPNANPDGYAYTHTEDRLWRKNRRYINFTCTGIDLNRNFKYMWRYSANSCAGTGHPGPSPLSEPETYALATYMESFKHNLRMYLSTHSFGNYVLWPFGFAESTYIKNWKEHIEVGQLWVNTIYNTTGQFYLLGNSADVLYTANGASDDHAIAYSNANLAFTLELTGGGGSSGFIFPQDRLKDLVEETFLGYRQFGLYIGEHYNYDDLD